MMQFAAAGAPGDEWTLNNVTKLFAPWGRTPSTTSTTEQIAWKDDGTSFFSFNGTALEEYKGSSAWEIHPFEFQSGKSFSVSSQDSQPKGLFVRSDGLKVYVTGWQNNKVYEYDLGTAWDVTTASFNQDYALTGLSFARPSSISFSPDGLRMFVMDFSNSAGNSTLHHFSLSTAWDISTASSVDTKSIASGYGHYWRDNGEIFYATSYVDAVVYEYTVTSPNTWNISTTTTTNTFDDDNWYQQGSSTTPSSTMYLKHISFKADGTRFYINNYSGTEFITVFNYDLSTAWDTTTAARQYPASNYYDFPGLDNTTSSGKSGLFFRPGGDSFYIADSQTSTVEQYDMSTPYDISTANFAAELTSMRDTDVSLSRDGTLLFSCVNDILETYQLNTPWDLSAGATFIRTFSFSSSNDFFFFREDGARLYTTNGGSIFYQYNLGTPYDTDTAGYAGGAAVDRGVFSIPNISSFRINNSGTKMIGIGPVAFNSTDTFLFELELASPWVLTSQPVLKNVLKISVDMGGPYRFRARGFDVRGDGKRVYAPLRGSDILIEYKLAD
jgi:hypothetical protein